MTFDELKLSKPILKAIDDQGYKLPTPIQKESIPIVLAEQDLVGCAQTGTGKTAAFSIPILHQLHRIGTSKKRKTTRCLIVTPTRELALQIAANIDIYSKYTNLSQLAVFGGVSQVKQVEALKKGVDVLIATPGRLLDLHKQGFVDLNHLHFLVLDEADQMLDMGFVHDVRKIVELTPDNRQTLLFSATMPMTIRVLAEEFLNQPKWIDVEINGATADKIIQKIYFVEKSEKRKLLSHVIKEDGLKNVLVFVRTKHGADNAVKSLLKNDIVAEAIHGDKSQTARECALLRFKNKEIDVLVATDIAARGIDISKLPVVINFDLPNVPETYVHRVGRTARAGEEGVAISFCGKDEKTYWTAIERLTKLKSKTISNHPYPWDETDVKKYDSATSKKDYRGKKKSNSRKSSNSKKNKKRWY